MSNSNKCWLVISFIGFIWNYIFLYTFDLKQDHNVVEWLTVLVAMAYISVSLWVYIRLFNIFVVPYINKFFDER